MENTLSMNCDRYSSINSLVHVLPPENLVEKCATVDECGRDRLETISCLLSEI